jgi:hypothetical protein
MQGVTGVQWGAVLTGAPDSLTDLDLLISSFTATLRASTSTFFSFVVAFSQLESITDRPNGDLVLFKTKLPSGSPVEVHRVNFNEIRSDQGARSGSVTIGGRTSVALPIGSTVVIVDVAEDNIFADGRRQLAVNPGNDVNPGETIDYDSTLTVVDTVEYQGDSNGSVMRLVEE